MPISSALGSSALLPAGLGHRNKFINGDMRIAQRGTAVITGSGGAQYPVDRWVVYNGTGTVTFAQSTVAPAGFTNSLNATVTATGSYSTAGYTEIRQSIEGFNCQDLAWGTASAKPITISFWVRSSVVGTYNVAIQNSGQNRTYVASFSILVANTWEYKTIQIAGDITGTWLVDNGVGLHLWFQLGMGSNYDTTGNTWVAGNLGSTSGAIDFAANSGATFYLTGVQLEQNYQPTPFEQRPYGTELALCQRYYYLHTPSVGNTQKAIGVGVWYTATQIHVIIKLAQIMRAQPTLIMPNGAGYYVAYQASSGVSISSLGLETGASTTTQVELYAGGLSGGTAGYASMFRTDNVAGSVAFSAEL
jgi:hypothetical protein